mmetsp:Transcript_27151/g.43091  ORF Transcript_27151/g.43091 Transcript_27151/m.43091 type:complete len:283 (-) Transcript_27151:68-916(-)
MVFVVINKRLLYARYTLIDWSKVLEKVQELDRTHVSVIILIDDERYRVVHKLNFLFAHHVRLLIMVKQGLDHLQCFNTCLRRTEIPNPEHPGLLVVFQDASNIKSSRALELDLKGSKVPELIVVLAQVSAVLVDLGVVCSSPGLDEFPQEMNLKLGVDEIDYSGEQQHSEDVERKKAIPGHVEASRRRESCDERLDDGNVVFPRHLNGSVILDTVVFLDKLMHALHVLLDLLDLSLLVLREVYIFAEVLEGLKLAVDLSKIDFKLSDDRMIPFLQFIHGFLV